MRYGRRPRVETVSGPPAFPAELEREIFQMAAGSNATSIPPLLLVCHRVHIWIEPFLYRVLFLNSDAAVEGIAAALQSKPAVFFEKAVRHMWLVSFSREARDTAAALLALLPRIESLFIVEAEHNLTDPALLSSLGDKCTRLGLVLHARRRTYLQTPVAKMLCPRLTHLILHDADGTYGAPHFAALPALTHLCLAQKADWRIVAAVLAACPRLHVLVRLWFQRKDAEAEHTCTIDDSRFVVMCAWGNFRADWERGVRGGDDLWARAERFIERKLRGELEQSDYLLLEDVV
ncbi:hypothetical protein B0H15DRAFT_853204 [Mycena belliarum]|uniref:Uncharacterized protein n=1 Tax=Mycena belliarum TaxID=1033014 RepID=A0AAD6U202_9AGAR|nr:hypothetical protein B0H15DRAFT_853204 [Mycena belliae]